MATGAPSTTARQYSQQMIHYLRRNVTFVDNGKQLEVGIIPAGSVILKPISGVAVSTAFNAGTTNVLDIGFTADDDFYATDLSLTALTFVPLDENVNEVVATDTRITVTVGLVGTAATAGAGVIVIAYIPNNDKGQ